MTLLERTSLVVCVVTYRRPGELAQLLPALLTEASAAEEATGGAISVDVLVVDNDPAASARSIVDAAGSPRVRYVVESAPGISAARNRALDETGHSDLLAFIDDDERPEPGWLTALLQTRQQHPATAVAGAVRSEFAAAEHPWIRAGEVFSRRHRAATRTGETVGTAATNNLLLDLHDLRRLGVRFDPAFGLSGGGDSLFTRTVVARGGCIVWCREAVVTEQVLATRMTTRWILRRALVGGSNDVRVATWLTSSHSGRTLVRARAAVGGAARTVLGAVRWLLGLLVRDPRHQARGAGTAARGLGMLCAAAGHTVQLYPRPATPAAAARPGSRPRPRVLMSAYACGPSDESEASAGWAFARAAARDHDVWLITRTRFRDEIEAERRADSDLARHLTVLYLDLSARVLRFKRRPRDVYWYYALWQHRLGRIAADLDETLHFDVLHHVSFAVDWLPCGLARLPGRRLVWGPVGGASYPPWALSRWLGARGLMGEVVRSGATRLARLVWGDRAARRAALVVTQNDEVARRFRGVAKRVVVEPNAALQPGERPAPVRVTEVGSADAGQRTAIFVGRLAPWKGCRLAVTALARPEAAGWRLEVYGNGADAAAVRALVTELGLDDRVVLHGHRPRSEVLAAYHRADAMIFPSMHDSAGWVVAEASAAGLPVVCLDVGGPPLLAGPNALPVRPGRNVVADLARALAASGDLGAEPYPRWSAARLPALLHDWYAETAGAVQEVRREQARRPA